MNYKYSYTIIREHFDIYTEVDRKESMNGNNCVKYL